MATQDDELMFSIGVMEKPDIKTRLAAVGKLFEDTQANISKGFVSVGQSVDSIKSSMGGVLNSVREFRDDSVAAASDIRSAMSLMTASASGGSAKADLSEMTTAAKEAAHAMVELERAKSAASGVSLASGSGSGSGPTPVPSMSSFEELVEKSKAATEAVSELQGKASEPIEVSVEMPEDLKAMFDSIGSQIEDLRDEAMEGVEVDFGLPPNLRNVFMQFSDVSIEAVDKIHNALDEKISSLAEPAMVATAQLKQEYAKRVADQAKAYEKMSEQMDKAVSRQMLAAELQGEAVKRAAHGLLAGVKGFVQLGLVGEESSEKILKGLVAIEGATSMLGGGVDILSALSKGWRSVRQSTDAASQVAKISAAMAGPQFVQLKAYQAQLLQETVAANAAATANMRLAASRGTGGVAGAAGSLVDGAKQVSGLASTATKAGGVAATAGTAAQAARFLAPVAVAVAGAGAVSAALAMIAAAGAALAAVSLVAVELSETFRGTATKAGSLNDTIASSYVGIAASAMRLTGMFEKTDSVGTQFAQTMARNVDATLGTIPVVGRLVKALNVFGDTAALAASNAAVERMQKKTARSKIDREAKDEIENVTRDAGRERFDNQYKTSSEVLRNNAGKVGGFDIKYSTESRIQNQTQSKLAQEQKKIEDYSSGVTTDKNAFDTAVKNATELKKQLQESLDIQMELSTGKGNQRGQAEWENQQLLMDELIIQQDKLNKMKQDGTASEKEMSDAVSFHQKLVENLNGSYEKQRGIIKETAAEQVQTEMRKQDMLRGQLDLQTAQIQKIEDQYRSAGIGFAKLGDIEKQMAADALQQAKTKGAASLEDYQKDLLRQVGSSEATRFANEGDMAEAKKFGFDASFGDSINQERKSIEATRTSIEAQLSTSYDVSVNLQSNAEDVANMVIDKANKLLEDQLGYIETLIDEKMNAQVRTINDKATFEKVQKNKNGG